MGVAAGGPTPREPVPLRRNRDFQLLWGGQAVSLLGSQSSKIAYPLLQILTLGLIVLARHDGASSAQIGLIVGCMGGLVGAFAAPWFQRRGGHPARVAAGWVPVAGHGAVRRDGRGRRRDGGHGRRGHRARAGT